VARTQGRSTLTAVLSVVGVLTVLHLVAVTDELTRGLTYVIAIVVAAGFAWTGVHSATPDRRHGPALVAAGTTAYAIGDLLWEVYVRSGHSPETSWADAGYLLSYVLIAGSILVLLVRGQHSSGIDAVVDALTVVVVSVLLFWGVSISDIVSDDSFSGPERVVLTAYPVLDAVLLALVARLLSDHRTRSTTAALLAAGAGCWLAADVVYLTQDLDGLPRRVLDLGWIAGTVLLAQAARTRHRAAEGPAPSSTTRGHLAIAVLPLLVPVALIAVDLLRGRPDQVWAQLVGLLLLIGLAVVRTARLLLSERDAQAALVVARDGALEASRAKSAFLATMSHEIRTPMNGVIGLTGLLLTTELDERQRAYAQGVEGAGEQLLAIINDILDFSKVEAGHLQLEEIDFDLSRLVERTAELVADAAQTKDVELLAYCAPEVPLGVRGDPVRVQQVLLNLVGNAVKFTERGEVVVSVHLADEPDRLRFEVRDTGIGIRDGDADRLFEAFSQADSSTTRTYGGTGLGLAIAQRLVAAMGGEIGVDSAPGEGSTFWFTLPLRPALDPATAPPVTATELAGARVLIVDDNATNRVILLDQTSAWGMVPTLTSSGQEALDVLDHAARLGEPYDLAVLDLCMPGMDGLELADRISHRRAPRPGAVLLTSGPDISAADAASAGIEARLTKPVSLPRLRETLLQVLGARLAPTTEVAETASVATRGHVLVVEDSDVNQIVAVGILEHLGFTTEVADDGRAALELLRRSSYDAVLMDCQMPEIDGYDATRALRDLEGDGPRTPVVALTAGAVTGERERCLAAGMDDYLAKPITPAEVDSVLSRWLPAAH